LSTLSGAAAERWELEQQSLEKIIGQLASASELTDKRSAFALLSDELLTLHHTFGIGGRDPLFELHCPMAFDGRGASWIQKDQQIRNPYYGVKMLKCADRVRPLAASQTTAPNQQAGHDH
jgi:Cu(I)/Ag(I) efflux system membrane fusion protein